MKEIEEAINREEQYIEFLKVHYPDSPLIDNSKSIILALEKQVARKVIPIKTNICECPSCRLTFYFYSEDYPPDDTTYCRWCGQKLNWEAKE